MELSSLGVEVRGQTVEIEMCRVVAAQAADRGELAEVPSAGAVAVAHGAIEISPFSGAGDDIGQDGLVHAAATVMMASDGSAQSALSTVGGSDGGFTEMMCPWASRVSIWINRSAI